LQQERLKLWSSLKSLPMRQAYLRGQRAMSPLLQALKVRAAMASLPERGLAMLGPRRSLSIPNRSDDIQ
jgi:hypothetical protein